MNTDVNSRACRSSADCERDSEHFGVPERVTLQETIKFGVECLFGSVGGSWVYEQLGLAEFLDERLGTAETVELVALREALQGGELSNERTERHQKDKSAKSVAATMA